VPQRSTRPHVFINYRREDSSGYAGRLRDDLAEAFGKDNIFMDIDTIPAGADFGRVVEDRISSSDVVLALIGKHWLGATDTHGRRRLDKPEDWVRLELESALDRADVRVIPTLVGGADPPSSDDLPAGLEGLARRHAFELSDARWRHDVEHLVHELGGTTTVDEPASGSPKRRLRRVVLAGIAVVLVLVGLAVLGVVASFDDKPSGQSNNKALKTYAADIDSKLRHSADTKGNLGGLIAVVDSLDVNSKAISRDDALAEVNQIIGERRSLLNSLPPHPPQAFSSAQRILADSISASIADDVAVRNWIEGVFSGSPRVGELQRRYNDLSRVASDLKEQFLRKYNTLRRRLLQAPPISVDY
jgi:hypothetical protein